MDSLTFQFLIFVEHAGKKDTSTEVTSLFKKDDRLGCSNYAESIYVGSGCGIRNFLSGCCDHIMFPNKKISVNYHRSECKYYHYFGNMWKARAVKN